MPLARLQERLLPFIIAFLTLIALLSFFASPYFKVSEIVFEGYDILKPAELDQMLRDYYHRNILIIDREQVKNRLIETTYIRDAAVIKRYPDQLLIRLQERVPLAKINNNGKFIFFTGDGYILEEGPLKGKVKVPLVQGVGYAVTQRQLTFSPVLDQIVQALAEMARINREMLTLIEVKGAKITAYLNKTPIYLGEKQDLGRKFKILQPLLEKIRTDQLQLEYIDLSILEKPVIKTSRN